MKDANIVLTEILLFYRLILAATVFHIGSFIVRNGIKMMPNDHPGKTYARSRFAEGNERISKAVCPKAATRLIQDRRRRAFF